ncbi:hypothetical protein BCS42_09860 [Crenothrix sp. D3]|nr:hypothetical protein BCS42_09860 [Crenothrix sp. D3]
MLQSACDAKRIIGVKICERLRAEIDKLRFPAGTITDYPYYHLASFSLIQDPYTGAGNLAGYWCNKRNKRRIERIGQLQFNSDGSFYAEYDVVKPHPSKAEWFVEAVTVWGKEDMIKAEVRLLPTLEINE